MNERVLLIHTTQNRRSKISLNTLLIYHSCSKLQFQKNMSAFRQDTQPHRTPAPSHAPSAQQPQSKLKKTLCFARLQFSRRSEAQRGLPLREGSRAQDSGRASPALPAGDTRKPAGSAGNRTNRVWLLPGLSLSPDCKG